jgi:glutaredoxin
VRDSCEGPGRLALKIWSNQPRSPRDRVARDEAQLPVEIRRCGAILRWAVKRFLSRLTSDPALRTRTRRKLLVVALLAALAVLALDRGPVWYYDPRRHHGANQVTVYSTSWCPVCARLRVCLREHGVPFEERDVEKVKRAGYEYWALGGNGVPLTLVGRQIASGLRRAELEPALRQAGYQVDCWTGEERAGANR